MYAIKLRLKSRSKRVHRDICTVYNYDELKNAEDSFNKNVSYLRYEFNSCINDQYFYGRVELIKSKLTPSQLTFTDDYDVEEIYGTYLEKGILKIGYLGG